ncbi:MULTISPECIES: DUF5610 domain-containing protein [Nitrincola]|uniref:DUF5610 domain-containing protein n=1 Tax=Nitrincola TaxID=267849 RepID=UPI0004B574E7|nr:MULTISPECIES: DUF5610 domain-containing protein [Nitrincola]
MNTIKSSLVPTPRPLDNAISSSKSAKPSESGRSLSELHDKVLQTLSQSIPGMSVDKFKKLDANQFTPEKVADRISGFVAAGLENARARGASEERIQQMYDAAMKGVEKGFKEAKEILTNLDVLKGKIAEDVSETERLTFDALAKLSPQQRLVSNLTQMTAAQRFEKSETFELNLMTKEGDKVSISFGRSESMQAGMSIAKSDSGMAAIFDMSRSETSGFSFSVQGNLNVDEIDAIQNLIRDVNQLANEFFEGDVQKAFEQAANFKMDTQQLASMSLTLTRSESYSAAMSYEKTQALGGSAETQRPQQRLSQLMEGMKQAMNEQIKSFVKEPESFMSELMKGLVQQDIRYIDAQKEQQENLNNNMSRLLESVFPKQ